MPGSDLHQRRAPGATGGFGVPAVRHECAADRNGGKVRRCIRGRVEPRAPQDRLGDPVADREGRIESGIGTWKISMPAAEHQRGPAENETEAEIEGQRADLVDEQAGE